MIDLQTDATGTSCLIGAGREGGRLRERDGDIYELPPNLTDPS